MEKISAHCQNFQYYRVFYLGLQLKVWPTFVFGVIQTQIKITVQNFRIDFQKTNQPFDLYAITVIHRHNYIYHMLMLRPIKFP